MVAAVYPPRQYIGAPPPTVVAPPSFGTAAAKFVAVHGSSASRSVASYSNHAAYPPANVTRARVPVASYAGSGRVPVAANGGSGKLPVGGGNSVPMWPLSGSAQVRGRCDALSRSAQFVPSNGLTTPLQQLRSVPASKIPQSPHQACVHHGSSGAMTPMSPLQKSSRDTLSASLRPYAPRTVTPQTCRPQGSPSLAGGRRAVSPRNAPSGHFVWPASLQAPSGSPLTPTRAGNRDATERRGQLVSSARTVAKAQASENTAPTLAGQAKSRSQADVIAKQGKILQSPHPQREVLRERNEQSPPSVAGRSPLAVPAERSPVGSPELGTDSSATLARRQGALCMDWQDVYKAANASPPTAAHSSSKAGNASPPVAHSSKAADAASPPTVIVSTSAGPKQTAPVPEEAQIVPRDLAAEVSDMTASLQFSLTNAHPMVTPEEKTFILQCLEAFSDLVEREGGFNRYAFKDECKAREELVGAMQDEEQSLTPQELLRRSSEATLRNAVRNGHDSVTVLLGGTYSMGMKKVVKIEVKCEELGLSQVMSIYWDWDVKLEQRSGQH